MRMYQKEQKPATMNEMKIKTRSQKTNQTALAILKVKENNLFNKPEYN